jgi:hypothetical protein
MTRARRATLVVAILGVAVAVWLRLWRLDWGLGEQAGFPEEVWFFAPYAAKFIPLSLRSFDVALLLYPPLHGYLVGMSAALAHCVGLVAGAPDPASRAAVLLARSVSAVTGVVTVLLMGIGGHVMYGPTVGLVALLLMAVAPLHAVYGHLGTTDTTLVAFITATLLAAYGAARSTRRAPLLLAGAMAGFAFASKYTGLACIVPVGWAILERRRREDSYRPLLAALALAAGAFAAAFALACPPCVLHPERMAAGIRTQYSVVGPFFNNALSPTLGWYGHRYLYQLFAGLPFALGLPLYAAALLGVVVAVRRRTLADRLLLASALTYLAAIGASRVVFTRYLLPLFPCLVLLAARALAPPGAWRRVRLAGLAAVWVYSLVFAASQIARLSYDQQRAVADWIAREVGRGNTVRAVVPRSYFSVNDFFRLASPLRRAGLAYEEVPDGQWFDTRPDVLVVPEWYAIALGRDAPGSRAARDLARLRAGDAGYRLGAEWRSSYLNRAFYTRLDPAFAGALWQGEIGFAVYVRDDVSVSAAPSSAKR